MKTNHLGSRWEAMGAKHLNPTPSTSTAPAAEGGSSAVQGIVRQLGATALTCITLSLG